MFTFRASITLTVMAFVVALAALLIAIQAQSLHWATREAASAYMDAASTKALGRLQGELNAIASLVNVLATSSSVADLDERSETGRAIPLFKAALQELPQMDSIYAGFENGAWLQVRRISDLTEDQRDRLRAPPNSDLVINLVRPTPVATCRCGGFFGIEQGNEIDEIDLWKYGYDARKRSWYWQTMRSDRPYVSAPYLSFSIGAPVITVSAPLAGKGARRARRRSQARHLQRFRPGPAAWTAWHRHDLRPGGIADRPSRFCRVRRGCDDASFPIAIAQHRRGQFRRRGLGPAQSHNLDKNEGIVRDDDGRDYLFRLTKFALGEGYGGSILLLAAQDDFVQNVRKLQFTGARPCDHCRRSLYSGCLDVRQHDGAVR